MKKSYFSLILIFLLFTTYSPKFNLSTFSLINIKKVIIENNDLIKEETIKKKINYLYKENLFFFNEKDLEKKLVEENFLESFVIKKIYPNTLKIIVKEKIPVAILQYKKNKFYITNEGSLINFIKYNKYNNLPTVFGDSKYFSSFLRDLKDLNFPIDSIKSFYFFESGRWDLVMRNDKVVKLPKKNYQLSLENFMLFKETPEFDNYKIFDYRIQDQLILN